MKTKITYHSEVLLDDRKWHHLKDHHSVNSARRYLYNNIPNAHTRIVRTRVDKVLPHEIR